MKKMFFLCVLILCGGLLVFNATSSQTNSVTNFGNVRLYVGKDPRPNNDGYVVYEVDTNRYAKLPDWCPDNFATTPPLSVSSAIDVAKTEMVKMYDTSKFQLALQEIHLFRTEQKDKLAWYYVVNYLVGLNETFSVLSLSEWSVPNNDWKMASVVVLMDGGVVEPVPVDMSDKIRLQGSDVMMNPDVILNNPK